MSRSYRHFPVHKERPSKVAKRRANQAVRRYKGEISDGSWYKRLFESWIISDYWIYSPRSAHPDLTDSQWAKYYRWK